MMTHQQYPTRYSTALAIGATVAFSSTADAERKVATGQIKTINAANRTISFTSGETFRAGPRVKLSTRSVGENVIVVYETADDGLQAIKVRRVPQSLETFVPLLERKPDAQSVQSNP